jgi:hypothetical protein
MGAKIERTRVDKPAVVRRGVAALVLVAAAILVIHFIAGLLTIVVVIAAIGAILWAANQLL